MTQLSANTHPHDITVCYTTWKGRVELGDRDVVDVAQFGQEQVVNLEFKHEELHVARGTLVAVVGVCKHAKGEPLHDDDG